MNSNLISQIQILQFITFIDWNNHFRVQEVEIIFSFVFIRLIKFGYGIMNIFLFQNQNEFFPIMKNINKICISFFSK